MRTGLKEGEVVIREFKRHWIVLVGPALAIVFASFFIAATITSQSMEGLRGFASLAWLILASYFMYRYFEREVDIWCVTNQRVIDEWGLITRNSKESPVDKIVNVSYRQPFIGFLMGYGDVEIQTAAEQGSTVIKTVIEPGLLKETIHKALDEFSGEEKTRDKEGETKECPYCAEVIKVKAKFCRFCGREL